MNTIIISNISDLPVKDVLVFDNDCRFPEIDYGCFDNRQIKYEGDLMKINGTKPILIMIGDNLNVFKYRFKCVNKQFEKKECPTTLDPFRNKAGFTILRLENPLNLIIDQMYPNEKLLFQIYLPKEKEYSNYAPPRLRL